MNICKLVQAIFFAIVKARFLNRHQYDSLEQIKHYQYIKLKELIHFAWNNIPFYHEYWNKNHFHPDLFQSLDDFYRIPFIDRNLVKKELEKIIPLNQRHKLDLITTGGTSGMPMRFYIDKYRARAKEIGFKKFIYKNCYQSNFRNRTVVIRGYRIDEELIKKNIFWKKNRKENALLMSSLHIRKNTYQLYVQKIREYSPLYIRAYPSAIVSLCKYMKANHDAPFLNLKGIICSSETVYEWQRKLIREVLGIEIFSFYGHSEKSVIAFQCKYSSLFHFDPYYGYTEFVNKVGKYCSKDGEIGEVVATGFDNFYFPFIRYKTGDLVEYTISTCPCNRHYLMAKKIIGRKQEFVYDKNGLDAPFTLNDEIFWNLNDIDAYQYIQNEYGKLLLLIQSTKTLSPEIQEYIANEAKKIFIDFDIEVKQVPFIKFTESGKFRYLIQNIKHNDSQVDLTV